MGKRESERTKMQHSRFKVLIVDGLPSDLEALRRIVEYREPDDLSSAACAVITATSGPETLKKVNSERPDLILLDLAISGGSGLDVLSAMKENGASRPIPVIMTGRENYEDEERCFRLGAVDYITKPFHPSVVSARIKMHVRSIEQLRIIEELSLLDALTCLPNRRSFDSQLATEWKSTIREKTPISLLMMDIDRFKDFNDTYGHQQGDIALKAVADAITVSVKRPKDFVARWGGEEFVVLLPNTDLPGALCVAETIRKRVERAKIPGVSNAGVTISIGAAAEIPPINSSASDFIERADKMLYAAKESGRNKVCS